MRASFHVPLINLGIQSSEKVAVMQFINMKGQLNPDAALVALVWIHD